MLFIEIEFEGDLVFWAVSEFRRGKRMEVDSGREANVSDALWRAGQVIEPLAPGDLV
jgi:hypothetical protein